MQFGKSKFYGNDQFLADCKAAISRLETLSDLRVLHFVKYVGVSIIPQIDEIGPLKNPVWREYSVSPANQKFGAEGVSAIFVYSALAYKNTRKIGFWVTGIPTIPAEEFYKHLTELLRRNSFDEQLVSAYDER